MIRFYLLTSILFLFSCQQERYDGFSKLKDGVYYQRLALGDGLKYSPGKNYMNYTFQSGFMDSAGQIAFDQIRVIKYAQTPIGTSHQLFSDLHAGDRFNFIIEQPDDSFFALFYRQPSPTQSLFIKFIVDAIEPAHTDQNGFSDPNAMEYLRILDYLSVDNTAPEFEFKEGVWVKIWRSANPPIFKNSIILNYQGYFLNGVLFDQTDYPLKFNRSDQWQVIPGIFMALQYMGNNDSGCVIIPSHLAFGEDGSKDGNVPPNEPVVYQLKIHDVSQFDYDSLESSKADK